MNTCFRLDGEKSTEPFAVTVDDDTLDNGTVTVRNRDTMEQETVAVDALAQYILQRTRLGLL